MQSIAGREMKIAKALGINIEELIK